MDFLFFLQQLLGYAVTFFWALTCPRAVQAARLLAVESQLATCLERIQQRKDPRPRFTPAFRLLWVFISKVMDQWEDLAQLVQSLHAAGERPSATAGTTGAGPVSTAPTQDQVDRKDGFLMACSADLRKTPIENKGLT